MGSSYSDLNLYFKLTKGEYGFPKIEQPNGGGNDNGAPKNGQKKENQKYTVKVSKSNYDGCVNFEKVTHSITFGQGVNPLYYSVLLYDGDNNGKGKGNNVFGYYYPNNKNEVLKELHVYYSVIAPNDPLVVSFYTHGEQIYNFSYSGLISTEWVRAYSISYYSFGKTLTTDHLTKEFQKLRRNRKIEFVIEKRVVDVWGYKQELENDKIYRYIYYPNGDKSVLGCKCLYKFDSETPEQLKCPETQDVSKSAENSQPSSAQAGNSETQAQSNSPKNYDNNIDPYYLDSVKGHFFDGVILYFVKNGNQGQNSTASGGTNSDGKTSGNGKRKDEKDNYDHNMAVLLELIDNCNTKTHLKRKDIHGNCWAEEQVKYKNDQELITKLKEVQSSANTNVSTTFILENKQPYKGVSKVQPDSDNKTTYKKYTHNATKSEKPNIIFNRQIVKKIGNIELNFNTQTLDVYFLKFQNKEEDSPFIIMFNNENETKATKPVGANGGETASGAGGGGGGEGQSQGATVHKKSKRCFYFDTTTDFEKWRELTVKNEESKDKKAKKQEPEDLDKKLEAKLEKIETNGKCQTELYLLRNIAFYILSTDEVDDKKIEEIKQQRPELLPRYEQKGTGTSLPVVLGSVAAGLVVLGTISAIIYGIYWYNTTIKLLT